jgi:signal transduction histidine kinase
MSIKNTKPGVSSAAGRLSSASQRRETPDRIRPWKRTAPLSPTRMAIYMALAVYICEALDMLLLQQLPRMTPLSEALFDSTFLMVLLTPVYLFFYRPFWREHQDLARDASHLSRQMIKTVEDERKRVSHELHDQCGQTLTALQYGMEALGKNMPKVCAQSKSEVGDLTKLLRQLSSEIREVTHSLRPALLEQIGLVSALQNLVSEFSKKQPQIEVSASYSLDNKFLDRLDEDTELVLYRVCQECLNNILKHAQASHVIIRLESRESSVVLNMGDKGVGFNPRIKLSTAKGQNQGVGLLGIQERVADLGGAFTLSTEVGKGTFITIELPVKPEVGNA